jgi:hypothetical protein
MKQTTRDRSRRIATDERTTFDLEIDRRGVVKAAAVAGIGLSGLGVLSRGAAATDERKVEVPVDVRPGSCPNPLNVRSKGVLSVAVLGTETFDATQMDPATVTLEGVPPLRWAQEDVATPYEPFVGKTAADDCTTAGPDGITDLAFKFETQEVAAALGPVTDGEVRVLGLTGELFDGREFTGEDVVVVVGTGE